MLNDPATQLGESGRSPTGTRPYVLLNLHGCPGALELILGLVRGLLVDLLQNRLRCRVHQVLGLLQPEARERTDLLDDLDLLLARARQDHVELGLLLRLLAAGRPGSPRCGHHDRRGGGCLNVEGLLELLHEVRELEQCHVLELLEQIVGAHLGLRHAYSSPCSSSAVSGCASSAVSGWSSGWFSGSSVASASAAGASVCSPAEGCPTVSSPPAAASASADGSASPSAEGSGSAASTMGSVPASAAGSSASPGSLSL